MHNGPAVKSVCIQNKVGDHTSKPVTMPRRKAVKRSHAVMDHNVQRSTGPGAKGGSQTNITESGLKSAVLQRYVKREVLCLKERGRA